MTAQASLSSDLSALFTAAEAPVQASAKADKLDLLQRIATASTVITCACFAALTILG